MAYTPTEWTTSTPINTDNLNNIENGIVANETANSAEVTRAKAAEKTNADAIEAEIARAKEAEEANAEAIAVSLYIDSEGYICLK